MTSARLLAVALVLAGCDMAAPPAPPAPTPSPAPLIVVLETSCASPVPTAFTGRNAELGYVGYRTCRGVVRNEGGESALVDVWVDALDAQGRRGGSCRQSVGRLHPETQRAWEATCPVTAAEVGAAVRITDAEATPLPTRSR